MKAIFSRARELAALLLAVAVVIAPVHAQTVEYIHTDALGTPVAITDANRNVVERSEYEPYGALLNRPLKDGPGYTGHVTDRETGLTYMQQRYYDPHVGRFLSVDPVTAYGGDMRHFGLYAYAYNNPYKFTDPDGRIPLIVPVIIAGISLLFESGDANAPARGEETKSMSPGEAAGKFAAVLPVGKLGSAVKTGVAAGKQATQAASKKQTGSYTNTHESGKTYDGKGGKERSQVSGKRVEKETGDKHVATDWTPAKDDREAFKQESQRLDSHGGPRSENTHNKMESPGKKMREDDQKR